MKFIAHRLYIEAESEKDATRKALNMGVYFNGVDDDVDCSCCGDRWYQNYTVSVYSGGKKEWSKKYGHLTIVDEPLHEKTQFDSDKYKGKIIFNTIEEYVQFLADEYGWTKPDCRIFYLNGTIKEFFTKNYV